MTQLFSAPARLAEWPWESSVEGGRGLRIVAGLTDAWGVRDRAVGKTVWAELTVERLL
ncbi:ATP-binding protein [Streptomyces sp. NPDC002851]